MFCSQETTSQDLHEPMSVGVAKDVGVLGHAEGSIGMAVAWVHSGPGTYESVLVIEPFP